MYGQMTRICVLAMNHSQGAIQIGLAGPPEGFEGAGSLTAFAL
jgi:hypothetical protein